MTAVLLTACGSRPPPASNQIPPVFHPQLVPDIPFPSGYLPKEDEPQLAVAYAGGELRRLHCTLVRVGERSPAEREVLVWYAQRLPDLGWRVEQPASEHSGLWQAVWAQGTERLAIAAGPVENHHILRLRLHAEE